MLMPLAHTNNAVAVASFWTIKTNYSKTSCLV